jgi:hypothetical protein
VDGTIAIEEHFVTPELPATEILRENFYVTVSGN